MSLKSFGQKKHEQNYDSRFVKSSSYYIIINAYYSLKSFPDHFATAFLRQLTHVTPLKIEWTFSTLHLSLHLFTVAILLAVHFVSTILRAVLSTQAFCIILAEIILSLDYIWMRHCEIKQRYY